MTDEITLRMDMDRATKAKALFESELFVSILASLEDDYTKAWRATRSHDYESRELAWHAVQALADVKGKLQRLMDNGIVAEAELKAAGL